VIITENKIAYVVASSVGWAVAGATGAAVANSTKRKKHPVLKGAATAAAIGAALATTYALFLPPDTGGSGQLSGPPRRLLSPRFP
jgi:hypothetical protein